MHLLKYLSRFFSAGDAAADETQLLALGKILSNQQIANPSSNINDYEFKIFSQFGDDGIIQFLTNNITIQNKIFIEFGVADYAESNTRFLMMNNNWSGFVMDGSAENITALKKQPWFWKYSLTAEAVYITKENINRLLADTGFANIGLLHIDLDGNDYHIFSELDLSVLSPSILVFEYNSVFGNERAVSVPYDKTFNRTEKHYSNLYWGASLPAFNYAAEKKGYSFAGCDSCGINSYFVKKELLNSKVKACTLEQGFRVSKFRDSRDPDFKLSYLSGSSRLPAISGLDVVNVITGAIEKL